MESRIYVIRPFSNNFLRREGDTKKYIGLAETSFKVRYANPKLSFHYEKYRSSTDLSKHFWNLSATHKTFHVTRRNKERARPYTPVQRKGAKFAWK